RLAAAAPHLVLREQSDSGQVGCAADGSHRPRYSLAVDAARTAVPCGSARRDDRGGRARRGRLTMHGRAAWCLVASLAVLGGCSRQPTSTCEPAARYSTAGSAPPMQIPDDLSPPDEADALRLP